MLSNYITFINVNQFLVFLFLTRNIISIRRDGFNNPNKFTTNFPANYMYRQDHP